MDKAQIVSKLKEGVGEVYFTKSDGSDREMYCTLNSKIIEEHLGTENSVDDADVQHIHSSDINESADLIKVFDIEKKEWRSFKLSTVYELYIDGGMLIPESY